MNTTNENTSEEPIAFIGGGNMASAIIGGLLKRGLPASQVQVVEPFAEQRARLKQQFQVEVNASPGAALERAGLVVWAVKPQTFSEAASQARSHVPAALHLSVAAGIRTDSIARWLGTQRVVRAMPNTPALIGQGITALFARPPATAADRQAVERVIVTTGNLLWLNQEDQLDAVTALSGSGPAYVFYFIEAMIEAGVEMGLSLEHSRQLALGTFVGASALAQTATEPPEVLRAQVTSRGGTTYAALKSMEQNDVKAQFMRAMHAARKRAGELGDEFGTV